MGQIMLPSKFGAFPLADLMALCCSEMDMLCRRELAQGIIVSERDYVSTLCSRIRDEVRLFGLSAFAQTVGKQDEEENGIDGIIVFRFRNVAKIGLYEAKWPRVLEKDYHWDSLHSVRKVSHFSEQIASQHIWQNDVALWEMFFNEGRNGTQSPPFSYFGSSCVWHHNTYDFMNNEGLVLNRWTTSKLKKLLGTNGVTLYSILFDLLSCRVGKLLSVNVQANSVRASSAENPRRILTVPFPAQFNVEIDDRILGFLSDWNIGSYLYIGTS